MLLQAPPPTQESEEGVPTDKVEHQVATTSSKVAKQQLGGGGTKRYVKRSKQQGVMAGQRW